MDQEPEEVFNFKNPLNLLVAFLIVTVSVSSHHPNLKMLFSDRLVRIHLQLAHDIHFHKGKIREDGVQLDMFLPSDLKCDHFDTGVPDQLLPENIAVSPGKGFKCIGRGVCVFKNHVDIGIPFELHVEGDQKREVDTLKEALLAYHRDPALRNSPRWNGFNFWMILPLERFNQQLPNRVVDSLGRVWSDGSS